MITEAGFNRCLSFINCQLQPGKPVVTGQEIVSKCALTISRQSGCGAHVIAEKIAQQMQARTPPGLPAWTLFDRNLMEKVLEDHHLPTRLAQFLPEDRISEIDDIMDELFGVHPSAWKVVEQTAETVLHLAELGNVIILGRGANIITARLPHVLHVRIVASVERRIENMRRFEEISRKAAVERLRREDLGRARYLKKYFGRNVEDPALYHLMVNTDLVSFDEAAYIISEMASRHAAIAAAG
jgi:cytidylate kinase